MTAGQIEQLEGQFHTELVSLLTRAQVVTRLRASPLLERVETRGALSTARQELVWQQVGQIEVRQPYFRVLYASGRLELSVEAIVVTPPWDALFTNDERERALTRLQENGFDPSLGESVATGGGRPLSGLKLDAGNRGAFLRRFLHQSECEPLAEVNGALIGGREVSAHPDDRTHLSHCESCRRNYPRVVEAYRLFDEHVFSIFNELLQAFKVTLNFSDERLEGVVLLASRQDYGEDEDGSESYECDRQGAIDAARPQFVWRAVRLACFIGGYMDDYARTHAVEGDPWLSWRSNVSSDNVSAFVRGLTPETYVLALASRNVYLALNSPAREDELWLPSDSDLSRIDGVLVVEETDDLDDWDQVLGKPSDGVNGLALLYLAGTAANQQAGIQADGGLVQAVGKLTGDIETMKDRQQAEIDLLERIVALQSKPDKYSCEESLKEIMAATWGTMSSAARDCLLGAEQVHRTTDLADPNLIVFGIARAFELELKTTIMTELYRQLKDAGVDELLTADTKPRLVYKCQWNPMEARLGQIRMLLEHGHNAIAQFCQEQRLDVRLLRNAINAVNSRRNPAAHGWSETLRRAHAVREELLRWGGLPGGVFAALAPRSLK